MYNSLSWLPSAPYNIMVYLANSPDAEDLWKLLAYNDYDALSKPNLTFAQKMDLVWTYGPQEKFSVFFTNLIEDSIPESKCVLKIYDYFIHSKELYVGTVVYAFDFLYGGQMSLVEYEGIPVSRGDLFIHILLKVLNGVEIGGVGKLTFFDNLSRYSLGKSVIGNSKTFTGVCIYLTTLMGDSGKEVGCGD